MEDDTEISDEVAAARAAKVAEMATDNGLRLEANVQTDYFGTEQTHTVMLPDGVSWIEHKDFTEGKKRSYQNGVNRDVRLNRHTQDATIKLAAGDDRKCLLENAISGWNLVRQGKPLSFSPQNLTKILSEFPPAILDLVEKDVRAKNAWLESEAALEDLVKERDRLNEMIEKKEKEEAGEASSSS